MYHQQPHLHDFFEGTIPIEAKDVPVNVEETSHDRVAGARLLHYQNATDTFIKIIFSDGRITWRKVINSGPCKF